jgi:type VI secretion system protein ImpK
VIQFESIRVTPLTVAIRSFRQHQCRQSFWDSRMNDVAVRTYSLASCYENAFTTILRLGSHQHAIPESQVFRVNIRAALKAAMEQAKSMGYSSEMIQWSVFAVVAFLDESVLKLQSPIFADWSQRPLQEELYGHHRAGEIFFENLRGLLARPDAQDVADCLEVYCLCLLLGYRGRYALGRGGEIEVFISQIREKIARVRGRALLFRSASPPPQIRRMVAVDRWSRGLGILALCLFLGMLAAYGAFWLALNAGIAPLG